MKFVNLFSLPKGKKITDKYLGRVLVSSICGILLCMGCLAGSTWAWFTVSLENTGNVIEIDRPKIQVSVADVAAFESGSVLDSGSYKLVIKRNVLEADFSQKSDLYVTLTVTEKSSESRETIESISVFTVLQAKDGYQAEVELELATDCTVFWTVSWFEPNGAKLVDGVVTLGEDDSEEKEPTKDEDEKSDEDDASEGSDNPDAENPSEGSDNPDAEKPSEGSDNPDAEKPSEGSDNPDAEKPSEGSDNPNAEKPSEGSDTPDDEKTSEEGGDNTGDGENTANTSNEEAGETGSDSDDEETDE